MAKRPSWLMQLDCKYHTVLICNIGCQRPPAKALRCSMPDQCFTRAFVPTCCYPRVMCHRQHSQLMKAFLVAASSQDEPGSLQIFITVQAKTLLQALNYASNKCKALSVKIGKRSCPGSLASIGPYNNNTGVKTSLSGLDQARQL